MGYLIGIAMVVVLAIAFFLVPPMLSTPETLTVILGFVLLVVLLFAWSWLSLKAVQLMANWAWEG